LLDAKNSRDFETEADNFARQWLQENHVAESSFDAILCRLSHAEGSEAGKKDFDFFSTHPATGKRASCKAPADAAVAEPAEAPAGAEPSESPAPEESADPAELTDPGEPTQQQLPAEPEPVPIS